MKQVYPYLYRWWLVPLILLFLSLSVHAQRYQNSTIPYSDRRQIQFLSSAPVLVPALVQQEKFDSLDNFLNNWYDAGCPRPELIFSIGLLAAVQTRTTSGYPMPWDCIHEFTAYSRLLKDVTGEGEQFDKVVMLDYVKYDASDNLRVLMLFLQKWAQSLETLPVLDSAESFYCRVFAGEITRPKAMFNQNPARYPAIRDAHADATKYYDSVDDFELRHFTGVWAATGGLWIPNGNLQLLGPHPYFGILLGGRSKVHEFDLAWSYKVGSAHQDYKYLFHDTLQSTSHAEGGMLGLAYTCYLIRHKYFELGLLTEPGMDYLIGGDTMTGGPQVLVGTFAYNNGLRGQFFWGRKNKHVGFTLKYHLLNYGDRVVTNLDGNAWTFDFEYGSY
ncbi:MAG: hypothetical protein QM733_24860 [Ilumatobacteraceae bacterium]